MKENPNIKLEPPQRNDKGQYEIHAGQYVSSEMRLGYFDFYQYVFGWSTYLKLGFPHFHKPVFLSKRKQDYSVWLTRFNETNKYKNGEIWKEEINEEETLITRTRISVQPNRYNNLSETQPYTITYMDTGDMSKSTKLYLVFGYTNGLCKFYGIFKCIDRHTKGDSIVMKYQKVGENFTYNLKKDLPQQQ